MIIKSTIVCFLVVFIAACSGSQQMRTDSQNVVTFQAKEGEAWCEICQLIMDRVKVLIQEKDKEGIVNATLYNLCDMVKGDMRQQCYAMVPMIKRQLTQGFDSKLACTMLQICEGGNLPRLFSSFVSKMSENTQEAWADFGNIVQVLEPHVKDLLQQYGLLKAKAGFSISCMLCKSAVSLMDKSLEQYKKPLTDYVLGICNDLPSPTNRACSDAMSFYIPTWWDEFFKNIASANEICFKLNFCQEPIVSTPPRKTVRL